MLIEKLQRIIVVATEEEAKYIRKKYDFIYSCNINGYPIYINRLSNGELMGFAILGIAKVTFCVGTQLLIDQFAPKEIISIGVAGGLSNNISVNDICLGVSSYQYDIICSHRENTDEDSLEYRRKKIYAMNDRYKDNILLKLNKIHTKEVTILTGDNFYTGEELLPLINKKSLYIVDQETAAFYQTCYYANVDYASIKIITDLCNSESKNDYKNNIDYSAMNLLEIFKILNG